MLHDRERDIEAGIGESLILDKTLFLFALSPMTWHCRLIICFEDGDFHANEKSLLHCSFIIKEWK
jgi:hypothetical protein